MVEISVKEEWIGKHLIELNLRKKYSVNVIAIRKEGNIDIMVDPSLPLEEDMKLIVIANTNKLEKLK